MKKITTAITLTELDGRILIVKNAKAGKWTLPGGQIDKGEKYFQAAERETMEETGLTVKVKKNKKAKTKRYGKKNKKQAVAYVGKVTGKKKVKLSHEHTDYKFLSPKKAIKRLIKRHRVVVAALLT